MFGELPTSYEAYNEMMNERYAPRYESEYAQAAAELGNDEYQRLIGGGDYIYGNCPHCSACLWTGEDHARQECFENRVEIAEYQLLRDIQAAYREFHPHEFPFISDLPF